MKKNILDTKAIIRYLVGDNTKQQEQAEQWFRDAEKGTRDIIVHPMVIAETSYILESFYKFSRDEIADSMEVFLSQRWLNVLDRDALLDLWQSYRAGMHFVDSYLHALAKNNSTPILFNTLHN